MWTFNNTGFNVHPRSPELFAALEDPYFSISLNNSTLRFYHIIEVIQNVDNNFHCPFNERLIKAQKITNHIKKGMSLAPLAFLYIRYFGAQNINSSWNVLAEILRIWSFQVVFFFLKQQRNAPRIIAHMQSHDNLLFERRLEDLRQNVKDCFFRSNDQTSSCIFMSDLHQKRFSRERFLTWEIQ